MFFYYRLYMDSKDTKQKIEFNPFDIFHFIFTVLARQMVIATKYALYSNEHHMLVQKLRLNRKLIVFDLLAAAISDPDMDLLWMRLEQIADYLHIDEKEFYFLVQKD